MKWIFFGTILFFLFYPLNRSRSDRRSSRLSASPGESAPSSPYGLRSMFCTCARNDAPGAMPKYVSPEFVMTVPKPRPVFGKSAPPPPPGPRLLLRLVLKSFPSSPNPSSELSSIPPGPPPPIPDPPIPPIPSSSSPSEIKFCDILRKFNMEKLA